MKILKILSFLFIIFFGNFQQISAQNYIPKSDQINQVLQHLRKDYVDPERLEPYKMLKAALENLARDIPSVVLKEIKGDPVNDFTLQVNQKLQKFIVPKIRNLNDLSSILQTIVIYIKKNLSVEQKLKNVDYVTINGFLSVLDPYTALLVPEIYTEFREDIGGNYSGVGMYIGVRDEKLQVISPIYNSPAYKAGLQAKDNILQIDGESTLNMTTANASSKIKGPVGSKVKLLIERKDFEQPKVFEIIRERISLKSANALELKTKTGRIGYIAISRFHKKTAKELEEVLDKLRIHLSDFKGIILDLRNNPGGILQQAVKVSDKFLKKGIIVTTAGIEDQSRSIYAAKKINTIPDIPIIVLINKNSASASEILAAALKQNNRALVLGTQSFGKGSVQQLRSYRDGSALKLTIAKYLTPNNNSLHSVGIAPHIKVDPWLIKEDIVNIISDKKLYPEEKDKFADWVNIPIKEEIYSFNYLLADQFKHEIFTTSKKKSDTAGFDIDSIKKNYLIYFATNILENNKEKNFEYFTNSALATTKKEEQIQNIKLQDKLEEIGISWSRENTLPKNLKLNFWVEKKEKKNSCSQQKKQELKAGSEITFCVELENHSDKETIRLQAFSGSEYFLFDKRQFVFGNIPPKQSKKWFVHLKIPEDFSTAQVPVDINIIDADEKEILSQKFFVHTVAIPQPKFQYSISAFSKDGKIIVPYTVDLKVKIANQTFVDSGELNISLKNGESNRIFLISGKDSIKTLTNKKVKQSNFEFELRKPIPDNAIDLSLFFTDNKYKKNISHNFTIPYGVKTYTIQNSAPTISVQNYPLITEESEVILQVMSKDDQKVKDLYIFNNDKKEFYQSFTENNIFQNVPLKLKQGFNKIVIFSRDNYNIKTNKKLFIYKK